MKTEIVEAIKNNDTEKQKGSSLFIRYGIGIFLLILIVIQLVLPRWKDIKNLGNSLQEDKNIEENLQKEPEKKVVINFLKMQVPLTGEYVVYANKIADLDQNITIEEKTEFKKYAQSPEYQKIKELLENKKIPEDFAYLAWVLTKGDGKYVKEDSLEKRKVGIWAMQKEIAKSFGLKVDYFVDERYDIEKSTQAMIKYIQELYNLYDDWNMVMLSLLSKDKRSTRENYVIASKYLGDRDQYIKDL